MLLKVPVVSMRTCLSIFMTLSWMSILTYYMIWQLLNNRIQLQPRTYQSDINVYGKPSSLLAELGFMREVKVFPQAYHDTSNVPVFAMALHPNDMDQFFGFLKHFRSHFYDKKLVIYNLGLSEEYKAMIYKECHCLIRDIYWERYPDHVRDLRFKAYRPLLIQETLLEFGAVFWCEVDLRFKSNTLYPEILTQATIHGLAVWPYDVHPTSTLTHYNMFRYFNTTHQQYYFHQMASPTRGLFCNTQTLHDIMLAWVKCALELDCLAPVGSQLRGCNFSLRPRFIYAGCHTYDTAAFNVILGLTFDYETPYIPNVELFDIVQPKPESELPVSERLSHYKPR